MQFSVLQESWLWAGQHLQRNDIRKCIIWQLLSTYSSSFSFGPMAAQHVSVTVWQYSVHDKMRSKLACEPFQGISWLPSGLVCAWQPVLSTAYPVAVIEFKCGGGVGVEASLHMGASSHSVPDPFTSASRTWVPVLPSLSSCQCQTSFLRKTSARCKAHRRSWCTSQASSTEIARCRVLC